MRRPSPALTVAGAALFVSLAGNAFAVTHGLITSKDIKDGSIQLVDLSSSARAALHGQRGPVGPKGPQGQQGQPGPAGPAADLGALSSTVDTLQTKLNTICAKGRLMYGAVLSGFSGGTYYLYPYYVYC